MKEEIVDISCGRRHSVMITASGTVWATGNFQEEKSARLQKLKAMDDK